MISTSEVLYEGKPHGEIKFDAVWYPVAEAIEGVPAPESSTKINYYTFAR